MLPKTSLALASCVKTVLRKMAQKITDEMHPYEKFAIQRFEENLTRRGAKKPFFHFTTVSIGGTASIGAVSLPGICALTVIADKEERKEASTEIEDLFEGVWKNCCSPQRKYRYVR